jgi:hypothetical protein
LGVQATLFLTGEQGAQTVFTGQRERKREGGREGEKEEEREGERERRERERECVLIPQNSEGTCLKFYRFRS